MSSSLVAGDNFARRIPPTVFSDYNDKLEEELKEVNQKAARASGARNMFAILAVVFFGAAVAAGLLLFALFGRIDSQKSENDENLKAVQSQLEQKTREYDSLSGYQAIANQTNSVDDLHDEIQALLESSTTKRSQARARLSRTAEQRAAWAAYDAFNAGDRPRPWEGQAMESLRDQERLLTLLKPQVEAWRDPTVGPCTNPAGC